MLLVNSPEHGFFSLKAHNVRGSHIVNLQEDAPRVFVLDDTTAPMVPKVTNFVTETVDEEESRRQAEETSKKGADVFLGGGNSHIF